MAMAFLHDFTGQSLQWKRPRFFSSSHQLRAGEQILATLSSAGHLKERAVAEAEGEQWIFQREGFLRRRSLIYPGVSQIANEPVRPLASIQPGWNGGGKLIFHDGRIYTWTHTGNWRSVWSWRDAEGKTLLTLKKGSLLEIAPAASGSPDLALLALFGLYLTLRMEADNAAVAAATIVSS